MQRFWRAFWSLVLTACGWTILSWLYFTFSGLPLLPPVSKLQLLTLPTSFPSLWAIAHLSANVAWLLPLVVLLVQVFLTGGLYGTLVRVNTGRSASVSSFGSDGLHSFGRLFFWNLLWTALGLFAVGIAHALPPLAWLLSCLILLGRYVFLFGDVALVCERDIRTALRCAAVALMNGFVAMLPYGLSMVILTGLCLSLTAKVPSALVLVIGLAYCSVMTWILHLVSARYLWFSEWESRTVESSP